MSIQTLPVLPTEIMNKILYEFKGLKHPVYTLEKTKKCNGCGEHKKEEEVDYSNSQFSEGFIKFYYSSDGEFEEYCSRHCAWKNGNVIDLKSITVKEIDEYFDGRYYPSFMEEYRESEFEYWVEDDNDEDDEDGFEEFFEENCNGRTFDLTLKIKEYEDGSEEWFSLTDEGYEFKNNCQLTFPKRQWVYPWHFDDKWYFNGDKTRKRYPSLEDDKKC